jgi:hypothetical protein
MKSRVYIISSVVFFSLIAWAIWPTSKIQHGDRIILELRREGFLSMTSTVHLVNASNKLSENAFLFEIRSNDLQVELDNSNLLTVNGNKYSYVLSRLRST